jgi:hypothetical protein
MKVHKGFFFIKKCAFEIIIEPNNPNYFVVCKKGETYLQIYGNLYYV